MIRIDGKRGEITFRGEQRELLAELTLIVIELLRVGSLEEGDILRAVMYGCPELLEEYVKELEVGFEERMRAITPEKITQAVMKKTGLTEEQLKESSMPEAVGYRELIARLQLAKYKEEQ